MTLDLSFRVDDYQVCYNNLFDAVARLGFSSKLEVMYPHLQASACSLMLRKDCLPKILHYPGCPSLRGRVQVYTVHPRIHDQDEHMQHGVNNVPCNMLLISTHV
jgi:hypothetical protein